MTDVSNNLVTRLRAMTVPDLMIPALAFAPHSAADRIEALEAMLDEAEAETARLRSLMGRYVAHVETEEGANFLGWSSDWITDAEADELYAAGKAARRAGEQL